MSQRNKYFVTGGVSDQNWKNKLNVYSDAVENNLRSISHTRPDPRQSRIAEVESLQKEALIRRMNADAVAQRMYASNEPLGSTKSELNSLLAAVQGSLADLRVEVAAAKRLSTHATAAVQDQLSPPHHHQQQHYGRSRPSSAPRPMRHTAENVHTTAIVPADGGHGASSLESSPGPQMRNVSPSRRQAAFLAAEASMGSLGTSSLVTEDQLVRVLDNKMNELGRRIEQQLVARPMAQPTTTYITPASNTAEPLVLLGMTKAEQAEKTSVELRSTVLAFEKQYHKRMGDVEQRVASVVDEGKQHYERICQLVSTMDAMQQQYRAQVDVAMATETVARLESRMNTAEASHARTTSELEEQQRLLLALTTAVQKATQDVEGIKAWHTRQEDTGRQLADAVSRINDIEARVSNLGNTLVAHKARELALGVPGGPPVHPVTDQRLQGLEEKLAALERATAAARNSDVRDARIDQYDVRMAALEAHIASMLASRPNSSVTDAHDARLRALEAQVEQQAAAAAAAKAAPALAPSPPPLERSPSRSYAAPAAGPAVDALIAEIKGLREQAAVLAKRVDQLEEGGPKEASPQASFKAGTTVVAAGVGAVGAGVGAGVGAAVGATVAASKVVAASPSKLPTLTTRALPSSVDTSGEVQGVRAELRIVASRVDALEEQVKMIQQQSTADVKSVAGRVGGLEAGLLKAQQDLDVVVVPALEQLQQISEELEHRVNATEEAAAAIAAGSAATAASIGEPEVMLALQRKHEELEARVGQAEEGMHSLDEAQQQQAVVTKELSDAVDAHEEQLGQVALELGALREAHGALAEKQLVPSPAMPQVTLANGEEVEVGDAIQHVESLVLQQGEELQQLREQSAQPALPQVTLANGVSAGLGDAILAVEALVLQQGGELHGLRDQVDDLRVAVPEQAMRATRGTHSTLSSPGKDDTSLSPDRGATTPVDANRTRMSFDNHLYDSSSASPSTPVSVTGPAAATIHVAAGAAAVVTTGAGSAGTAASSLGGATAATRSVEGLSSAIPSAGGALGAAPAAANVGGGAAAAATSLGGAPAAARSVGGAVSAVASAGGAAALAASPAASPSRPHQPRALEIPTELPGYHQEAEDDGPLDSFDNLEDLAPPKDEEEEEEEELIFVDEPAEVQAAEEAEEEEEEELLVAALPVRNAYGAGGALMATPGSALRTRSTGLDEYDSPATPPEDASVLDKALYYDKLAAKQVAGTSSAAASAVAAPHSVSASGTSSAPHSAGGADAAGAALDSGSTGGAPVAARSAGGSAASTSAGGAAQVSAGGAAQAAARRQSLEQVEELLATRVPEPTERQVSRDTSGGGASLDQLSKQPQAVQPLVTPEKAFGAPPTPLGHGMISDPGMGRAGSAGVDTPTAHARSAGGALSSLGGLPPLRGVAPSPGVSRDLDLTASLGDSPVQSSNGVGVLAVSGPPAAAPVSMAHTLPAGEGSAGTGPGSEGSIDLDIPTEEGVEEAGLGDSDPEFDSPPELPGMRSRSRRGTAEDMLPVPAAVPATLAAGASYEEGTVSAGLPPFSPHRPSFADLDIAVEGLPVMPGDASRSSSGDISGEAGRLAAALGSSSQVPARDTGQAAAAAAPHVVTRGFDLGLGDEVLELESEEEGEEEEEEEVVAVAEQQAVAGRTVQGTLSFDSEEDEDGGVVSGPSDYEVDVPPPQRPAHEPFSSSSHSLAQLEDAGAEGSSQASGVLEIGPGEGGEVEEEVDAEFRASHSFAADDGDDEAEGEGRDALAQPKAASKAPSRRSSAGGSRRSSAAGGAAGSRRSSAAGGASRRSSAAGGRAVQGTLDYASEADEVSSEADSDLSSLPSSGMHYGADEGKRDSASGVTKALMRNPLGQGDDDANSSDGELEVFERPAQPRPLGSASRLPPPPASATLAREAGASSSGIPRGPSAFAAGAAASSGSVGAARGIYRVHITTGSKVGAGTGEAVTMTLTGAEGSYRQVLPNPGGARFQRGTTDEVEVNAGKDLGEILNVHLWHTGQGFGASWYLEKVVVEQPGASKEWEFIIHDWVRGGEGAGRTYKVGLRTPSLLSRESSMNSMDLPLGSAAVAAADTRSSSGGGSAAGYSGAGATGGGAAPAGGAMSAGGVRSIGSVSGVTARSGPAGRAGYGDESMSLDFDDDEELPMFATSGGGAGLGSQGGAPARIATPGVVLDEDLEDVSAGPGMAFGSGSAPVTTTKQPPSQQPTPRGTASLGGRPPLPPTPTGTRSSSGGGLRSGAGGVSAVLSGDALLSSSLEGPALGFGSQSSDLSLPLPDASYGSFTSNGSGRRLGRKVRTSGGVEGLEPESSRNSLDFSDGEGGSLGVEGSERSLSGCAPGGVRPPMANTSVGYLGTSRKRVSFSEYSEQWDFHPSDGDDGNSSVTSLSEDEMLTAQGARSLSEPEEMGYDEMLQSDVVAGARGVGGVPSTTPPRAARPARGGPEVSPGAFEEVPLGSMGRRAKHGRHAAASSAFAYKLKVFTADKMNAGLGATNVHMEILGSSWVIGQALPKGKGAFQRGCVDRFTIAPDAGDLGVVLAIKVWHEGSGSRVALNEGRWNLARVEIENKVKGVRYVFTNAERDGWISRGKRCAVVLKPTTERIDELEDLREVQREIQTQLQTNRALDAADRTSLASRLARLGQRITSMGGSRRSSAGGNQ